MSSLLLTDGERILCRGKAKKCIMTGTNNALKEEIIHNLNSASSIHHYGDARVDRPFCPPGLTVIEAGARRFGAKEEFRRWRPFLLLMMIHKSVMC
jgi:hypothetical protein